MKKKKCNLFQFNSNILNFIFPLSLFLCLIMENENSIPLEFSNKFYSFEKILPNFVDIKKTIHHIPEENLVESRLINCNIDEPQTKHIVFFDKINSFGDVKGFVPPMKGNPYYTSGYYDGLENDLNYQAYHHNTTIVHLKNMFVTYSSAMVTEEMTFLQLDKIQKFARNSQNGSVSGYYDHVIALSDAHIFYFSHWFYDTLAPLTIFPSDIISKSYIIRYRGTGCVIDPIYALGVKKSQILIVRKKEWIFARNLYTTVPQSHNKHYGLMFKILAEKIRKYYEVDSVEPSVYGVTNRNIGEPRYIKNLETIFPFLQEHFKEYKLTFFHDSKSLKSSALQWSACRFVFTPTGSNCIKHLFLKEGSVMVVALGTHTDNCIGLSAAAHGIYILYYRVKTMDHWVKESENTINITEAKIVFDIGLYCAKNGKWKDGETFQLK